MKHTFTYDLEKKDQQFINRIYKGKDKVTLTMYILKGGCVSHQIQPTQGHSDMVAVAKECWNYVVESTHIQTTQCNCLKIKNVDECEYSNFVTLLSKEAEYKVESLESKNAALKFRNTIEDRYGAKITVNYYTNGTMTLQGALSPMYAYISSICVSLLGDIDETDRADFLSYYTTTPAISIDPNLSVHIENLKPITGNKIDILIEISIKLANMGVAEKDNGWISFSVLKALDALLSLKLTEGDSSKSFELYSDFFVPEKEGSERYIFKSTCSPYQKNVSLKSALEDAYTYFRKQRNTSFHIDRQNIATSRMMSYEEAVEVVKECIKLINRICRNW